MSESLTPSDEERLLATLADAVGHAPRPVREIEVGIALSIALGRRRSSVPCGGCETPLDFNGIPARTNSNLDLPFRLILTDATDS